jgi:hypothetical protein
MFRLVDNHWAALCADMKGREELMTRGRAMFAAIAQHLLCKVAVFAKRVWLVCDRVEPRTHLYGARMFVETLKAPSVRPDQPPPQCPGGGLRYVCG